MADLIEKQADIMNKLAYEVDQTNKKLMLREVVSLGANTPIGMYAQVALAEDHVDDRIKKISNIIRLQPNFHLAHNDLALAYLEKGEWEQAEREMKSALEQGPNVPLYYNTLGFVYFYQDRFGEAREAYEKAIELLPSFVLAHYNLGTFYYKFDMNIEAEREFRESIRLLPEFTAAHTYLGLVLFDKNELDEAEDCFEDALRLDEDYWLTHFGLGSIHAANGDILEDKVLYDDALVHLNKALEGVLKDENLHAVLGSIYSIRGYIESRLGHFDDSRTDFIKAVKLVPTDSKSKRNLRRLNDVLKDKRIPDFLVVLSNLLGGVGFVAFIASFILFSRNALLERNFLYMSFGFFVLTLVCFYLPHITRLKIGSVELEKINAKSLNVQPRLEI